MAFIELSEQVINNPDDYVGLYNRCRNLCVRKFDMYDRDVRFGKRTLNQEVVNWYYDVLELKVEAFLNIPAEILEYV